MSYDFSMSIDAGGTGLIPLSYDENYTSNVGCMFRDAFSNEEGVCQLNGLTGKECHPILKKGILAMVNDQAKYKAMNPDNGWGDYEGALELLVRLNGWCLSAPNAIMRVSY